MFNANVQKLFKQFINDTKGNFGVMAATTALGVIGAAGMAIDGQRFYQHAEKAQSVADAASLTAAIYATNNHGSPENAGAGVFLDGVTYSATELGFELGGGETIDFMVEYNDADREVTVTTTGSVTPIMLQLVGKEAITTRNSSTAKFTETDVINPASVMFVLDNSGSMLFDDKPLDISNLSTQEEGWYEFLQDNLLSRFWARWLVARFRQDGAVARVSALQEDLTSFNDQLSTIINNEGTNTNILRTGMITYNNQVIRDRQLNWGVLDQVNDIDSMSPINGTDSSVAFTRAVADFADEDTQHLNRNGSLAPAKYLIFMSDGQNTDNGAQATQWTAVPNISPTGLFRAWGTEICKTRFNTGSCDEFFNARYYFWDVDVQGAGSTATTPTEAGWSGNWEEGRFLTPGDSQTIADCETLKAQNVTIYTIAFALDTGDFDTNGWADLFNPYRSENQAFTIEAEDVERAFSLLDACATDDNTFLLANNADDLSIAFDQIRLKIAADIVRLQE